MLRRALGVSFGASLSIQLLNVATGVLLARAFSPVGRGELAAILLWPNVIATLATFGIFEAVTFHVAKRETPTGAVVGSGLAIAVVEGVVFLGVTAGVVPLVLQRHGATVVANSLVYAPTVVMNAVTLTLAGVLNGLGRYPSFQALRVLVNLGSAVALFVLAATDALTLRTAVYAYLLGQAMTLASAAVLVARTGPLNLVVRREIVWALLRYGAAAHSGAVSNQLNQRLDQLVISAFLSSRNLALYVIAVTMTSITALVGGTVALVALPLIAKPQSRAERVAAASRMVSLTLWTSLLLTVPLVVFAPQLLVLFFGSAYHAAFTVTRILLVAAVVLSTARTVEAVLRGVGRPLDAGVAELVALGMTVGGLAVLLPALGIVGAGLASLLAYVTSLAWMWRRAARALEVGALGLANPRVSV